MPGQLPSSLNYEGHKGSIFPIKLLERKRKLVTFNKIVSSFANEIETNILMEVVYRVFRVEEILVFDDHLDDFG